MTQGQFIQSLWDSFDEHDQQRILREVAADMEWVERQGFKAGDVITIKRPARYIPLDNQS
jgi:hypothetical protein